jgi:hypothetical protein
MGSAGYASGHSLRLAAEELFQNPRAPWPPLQGSEGFVNVSRTPINCSYFPFILDWLSKFTNKRKAPALP